MISHSSEKKIANVTECRKEERQLGNCCFYCGISCIPRFGVKRICSACRHIVSQAKSRAANAVKKAIRHGKLLPPKWLKCVDCSKPAAGYDHRSYNEPLNVEPVCTSCNHKRGPAKWIAA